MRQNGVTRDVVSAALNHIEPGITSRHYDMYEMLPERRAALDGLAKRVETAIAKKRRAGRISTSNGAIRVDSD
jgi:hypothetical protein